MILTDEVAYRGPIVCNINVYRNLFDYQSGIYTEDGQNEYMGMQTVCLVGWNFSGTDGYW